MGIKNPSVAFLGGLLRRLTPHKKANGHPKLGVTLLVNRVLSISVKVIDFQLNQVCLHIPNHLTLYFDNYITKTKG